MTMSAVHGQPGAAAMQFRDDALGSVPAALAPAYPAYAAYPGYAAYSGYGHRATAGHAESGRRPRLTARQHQVLSLVAEGLSNSAIARLLFITERAVVQHVSHIYDQLDLALSDDEHRRVRAVLWYIAS